MTKSPTNMDLLDRVQKSPELTSYVIRNYQTEAKKNAIIYVLIASMISLVIGVVVGLNLFGLSQPKNIVEVQVSKDNQQ